MAVVIVESRDGGGSVSIRGLRRLKSTMEADKYVELTRTLGFEDTEDLPNAHKYHPNSNSYSPNKYNSTMTDSELLSILVDYKFRLVSQAGGTTRGGKSKVQEKLNLNIIVTFAIYIFSGIDLNNINHAFVVFYLVCDLSPYIL